MLTRLDPWNNLLRTTIAAFAAGVAGADAVTVLPFDTPLGIPDELGRRLARNISSLLIAESHVAAVFDPAAGAPALERLTSRMADAAWAEFSRIEAAGGIVAALADGSFHQRADVTAAERARRIATRTAPITGVTEFPDLTEAVPTRRPWPEPVSDPSWAAAFHRLRDRPISTPVFIATLGPVAEHSARAGFVVQALAAGGVRCVTAGATTSAGDVVAAYATASVTGELPVVCVAGSDTRYAALGSDTISALRTAGARWVVSAGVPNGLPVDDSLTVGDDILAFLHRTRARLALEPAST